MKVENWKIERVKPYDKNPRKNDSKMVWRFGRVHHHVDYRPFKNNKLVRREDIEIPTGVNNYGMKLVHLQESACG